MAIKTLFISGSIAGGSNFGELQDGGSAPTAATLVAGWVVAKTAADNYASMSFGTELAATVFSTTLRPEPNTLNNAAANAWRTQGYYRGVFAAGNWFIGNAFRAVTNANNQQGEWTLRIYRSENADGASATEITTGLVSGSQTGKITTGTDQTSSLTLALPVITMSNEYLFFEYGWRITVAAGNANSDVDWRTGASSFVNTTDFQPAKTFFLTQEGGYFDVE